MTIEGFSAITQAHLSRFTTMLAIVQNGVAGKNTVVNNGTGMFLQSR